MKKKLREPYFLAKMTVFRSYPEFQMDLDLEASKGASFLRQLIFDPTPEIDIS